MIQKEKRHLKELSIARKVAFTDALTGVKSKSACDDYILKLQELIDNNEYFDFAISIFDCNNLKEINDNYGHDKGDEYLKATSALICKTFKHSPVFRIGGDEFVAFLTNDDYKDRKVLIKQFEKLREETYEANRKDWEKVSVAVGMAEFDPSKDSTVNDTVNRADRNMYEDKRAWKESHSLKRG